MLNIQSSVQSPSYSITQSYTPKNNGVVQYNCLKISLTSVFTVGLPRKYIYCVERNAIIHTKLADNSPSSVSEGKY
jgi:tRNA A37 threonylcarbamoyladenosine biosynthesis protein TsaE